MKKKHIAYCGLVCSDCDAYIATKNNDDKLREKTANNWNIRYKESNRNRPPVKPVEINCNGCLSNGPIYFYCKRCNIRNCGLEKGIKNCKDCENYKCKELIELQKNFF